jgi:hypothetical protein
MRKLLLGVLSLTALIASAQDLQTVLSSIASNDYISAQKQIDSFLLDKKNSTDAPAWYYKGRIYTEVVRQHDKTNYIALQEAFKAYRRYQELDPANKLMQLTDNIDLFQLFDLSYNTAADFYNEGSYGLAYNHFKTALDIEDYIRKKGFSFQGKSFSSLDTSLINLTGSAAYLSNREEEAIPYFERLASAKIIGDEYKGIYALLYQHYLKKNDPAKAAKYLTTGRELIPDNEYWIKMELATATSDKDRFTRYEQLLQKYPSNFSLIMDYAVDLFNYMYAATQPADFESRQSRLQALLTKALSIDPNSAIANFVMSQHVYNQVYDIEDALRALKEDNPADQTKKKTLAVKLDQKYADLLSYSSRAYERYSQDPKPETKENCRKLLNQLITCYQKKAQWDKVNYYQEKLSTL